MKAYFKLFHDKVPRKADFCPMIRHCGNGEGILWLQVDIRLIIWPFYIAKVPYKYIQTWIPLASVFAC